ncbi:MAG: prepilin-type N-terminal cleavage/methylation domain-containing protein, partial [Proteobacteria bacterium]|nr:prepilin-type N-terminal cleavage/methylation domain-containing protein [Pseudomonadota bacterium]
MKKSNRQYRNNRGFTLVELMITLVIVGIISAAMYTAFTTQLQSYTAQDQVAEMQQNIRAAMDIMTREIRMAGFDPRSTSGADITTATAANLVFTLVADGDGIDNDNADGDNNSATGADEPDELKMISYDLYDAYADGDTDIGRQ